MAYSGGNTADKVLIARVIIAFVCLLACGYQIYAGFRLIASNTVAPREITYQDFADLTVGEEVSGTIDNIVMEYVGDSVLNGVAVTYYISKTEDGRLMSYRVESGSYMDSLLKNLSRGGEGPVTYRGAVHPMNDTTRGFLNMQLIAENVLQNNGIKGGTQHAMIPYIIDVVPTSAKIDDRYVVFTFIGAGLMLLLAFLVMRKPLKNLRESMRSRSGKYRPEFKVTQDDLVFENEGYYEGLKDGETEFFVNTEYNIRGEGNTGLIRGRIEAEKKAAEAEDDDDEPKPEPPKPQADKDFFYEDKGPDEGGSFYHSENNTNDNNTNKRYRRY